MKPPYSCFCAIRDSHYNLEWYIQTTAVVSNKRVSQEIHRQLHSDFKTTDVTIQDYPAQFIDFQRGQHHHSSNMKYQATSSPTATHVVNDQSNFKQPNTHIAFIVVQPEFLQPYLYPRISQHDVKYRVTQLALISPPVIISLTQRNNSSTHQPNTSVPDKLMCTKLNIMTNEENCWHKSRHLFVLS